MRLFCAILFITSLVHAETCENLSNLKLKDTTITSAQTVPAGQFTPGAAELAAPGMPANYKDLPAFCRVTAEIKPTQDSDIKIEVWMPGSDWNGKYLSNGNGGFAGSILHSALANGVKHGYAMAATDTGHSGSPVDATWALHHPEKIVDFGYRGIHEMTVKAKAIIETFYGKGPQRSYFSSCSNGGRQALMEAQRFPADYDGIIAGAPANFWTHLLTSGVWNIQAMQNDPASYIPAAKIPALNEAVLAACDAKDGVTDGVLNDPRECHFDPSSMLCKAADSNTCLTAPQAAALKKIYAGAKTSKGEQIFPGFVPGGESGPGGWPLWVTGGAPGKSLENAFSLGFFANMVFDNAAWDFKTFDFDRDTRIADQKQAANLNSTDPNLKPFRQRGGKLIIYHGWSDAAIQPLNTIDYYNSVEKKMGASDTNTFVRLYMAPGMQHCGGGPGPSSFGQYGFGTQLDPQHNMLSVLEQWVEKGVAPDRIIATKYNNDMDPTKGVKMTRPLCPYPQVAKYKGSGDTNDEANFTCSK
ncbi:MAG TPA: tannase/feruloyl esterase family alpha/beta hydrolase [Candidatus Angelobacter sp.]